MKLIKFYAVNFNDIMKHFQSLKRTTSFIHSVNYLIKLTFAFPAFTIYDFWLTWEERFNDEALPTRT